VKDAQALATTIMVFSGEYDLAARDQLRAALDSISAAPRIALDLSDVSYIDSTIIHELLRLHNARAAHELERETIIVRTANLLKVFGVLSLASVFRIVESLDEFVAKDGEHIVVQYASSFDGAARADDAITA
jgi:anti-anti-sigma factor